MRYVIGVFAVLALLAGFGAFYTVDEGERAVITRNGKVIAVSTPGMQFKMPFMDDNHTISVRTQVLEFPNEPVYTADRQTANVTFSVNYVPVSTPEEIKTIYTEYQTLSGLEDRILKRQVREHVKTVFGRFTADLAIRERGRLSAEVNAAIMNIGDKLVRIEGSNFENIDFSKAVEDAAEDRAKAEMLVQTETQKLAREKIAAEIVVATAKGTADSNLAIKLAEADANRALKLAEAEGILAVGKAEAEALKLKSEAINTNPLLVDLTRAQNWNGQLPTTMVPDATIPFMNMK